MCSNCMGDYENPYDELLEVSPPTIPGRHTQRLTETSAGGPVLPSAADLDAVVAEREIRVRSLPPSRTYYVRKAIFSPRVKMVLFWTGLVVSAVGMGLAIVRVHL